VSGWQPNARGLS